jgi:hypothetical protein
MSEDAQREHEHKERVKKLIVRDQEVKNEKKELT